MSAPVSLIVVLLLLPSTLLAQRVSQLTARDSLAMLLAVYETAFKNGVGTAHAGDTTRVVCVDPPENVLLPDTLFALLQADRKLLVRRASACTRDTTSEFRHRTSRSLMIDTLTGRRGISIGVRAISINADGSFTFETGYWEHGLSSAAFWCSGRRRENGWEVKECKMLWIS